MHDVYLLSCLVLSYEIRHEMFLRHLHSEKFSLVCETKDESRKTLQKECLIRIIQFFLQCCRPSYPDVSIHIIFPKHKIHSFYILSSLSGGRDNPLNWVAQTLYN